MEFRTLGGTGATISRLALGAGPIANLMTGDDMAEQRAVLVRAIDLGINWIDTAATYGNGASESHLGRALRILDARDRVQIATKVRLLPEQLSDMRSAIFGSLAGSLQRLEIPRVTLLQLHNAITAGRGTMPTSVTVDDVLCPGGIADLFDDLRHSGLVQWIGFSGIGDASSLLTVADSGRFDTMQVPFGLANATAAYRPSRPFSEADYGQVIDVCQRRGVGVLAIRVLAGGALASQPPSEYTHRTRFFPIDLYHRDELRASQLAELLPPGMSIKEAALRFPLNHRAVASLIVGLASVDQLGEVADFISKGPLPDELHARLLALL